MRLAKLVRERPVVQPDFSRFLHSNVRASMPPLNIEALRVSAFVEEQRAALRIPTNGIVSFLLNYKGHAGGVISLDETHNGDVWDIGQVQGARSRKAYRVHAGMRWPDALADLVLDYAKEQDADVRHITMPRLCNVENICEAVSRSVDKLYLAVVLQLNMRFSDEINAYIVDVERDK